MEQLPVFLNLRGRTVLVVGGGTIAERKVSLLRCSGAHVTINAPTLTASLLALRDNGTVTHIDGLFEERHLHGQRLVIAATDNREMNRRIAQAADSAGVFCNAVDDYDASTFTLPAIVDRSPVVVAIGTSGNSPVLARRLKAMIERSLPARIGELAMQAGRWRELVSKRFPSLTTRRKFWERFFDGPAADALLTNNVNTAEKIFRRSLLAPFGELESTLGEAYIVGAGPGDPGLVTLRAQQLIAQADVVLYDRLVSPPILDFARKEAEMIAVGKSAGQAIMKQADINALLVKLVASGKRVCRLKGGDPLVFGRGGEEAEDLAAAGLRYQIVPGISAALGCAAYAGIPLTHRGISRSVTFATASLDGTSSADWPSLASSGQTLAIYMSVGVLEKVVRELTRHGLSPDTPAAMVANGTTSEQRVIHASLENIAQKCRASGISAPAMLFVGESVRLGVKLDWFGGESQAGRFPPGIYNGFAHRQTLARTAVSSK
jgi:uroporphyrin-III C-methyltransferase/precorrin-2 dehydrogenase/sirohydrochlorin ferrochelatase